jgi:hypothetical protein
VGVEQPRTPSRDIGGAGEKRGMRQGQNEEKPGAKLKCWDSWAFGRFVEVLARRKEVPKDPGHGRGWLGGGVLGQSLREACGGGR